MITLRFLSLTAISCVLTACSAMSDKECLQADWSTVGQLDAEQGRVSAKRLEKYRKSCADVSITPDVEQYQQGYQRGLLQFCTQSKGYYFGLQGGQYQGTCHSLGANEASFVSGYAPAAERYKLERKIDDLERQMAKEQTRFLRYRPRPPKKGEHPAEAALWTQDHYQTLFWLRMELLDTQHALSQWKKAHQSLLQEIHIDQ